MSSACSYACRTEPQDSCTRWGHNALGCLVYKMSTHLSSSRAHGHIIFPLHLSLHTCMKECAYPPQYKAEAFERVRDLSLNMLQGTTPRRCCICWMPSAHVLDAWGYDILRRPSRSANMNEGALLSVVSRMVKDRCCPVLSEAGRTSSMPPACMQGFRCCQCMGCTGQLHLESSQGSCSPIPLQCSS